MSCGVGCRLGLDLVLLWLWRRPAAPSLIRPLAWEPTYSTGMAPEKTKNKQTNKKDKSFIHSFQTVIVSYYLPGNVLGPRATEIILYCRGDTCWISESRLKDLEWCVDVQTFFLKPKEPRRSRSPLFFNRQISALIRSLERGWVGVGKG